MLIQQFTGIGWHVHIKRRKRTALKAFSGWKRFFFFTLLLADFDKIYIKNTVVLAESPLGKL